MLDSRAQERAFGLPGEPGDPAIIDHLATRLVGLYEQMLDGAAILRGSGVQSEMAPILEAVANYTTNPLRQFRSFIDQIVTEADSIPERLKLGRPVEIDLTLTLSIDEEAQEALDRELDSARRTLGF